MMQAISGSLPGALQSKRDSADADQAEKFRFERRRSLWHRFDVIKRSSKLLTTLCQDRYPSPMGWPDLTRIRSPFGGLRGVRPTPASFRRFSADFTGIPGVASPIAAVRYSRPCDSNVEMSVVRQSGATTSGDFSWLSSSKSSACLPLTCSAPMSPVARLSVAHLARPATTPRRSAANLTTRPFGNERLNRPVLCTGRFFFCIRSMSCSPRF